MDDVLIYCGALKKSPDRNYFASEYKLLQYEEWGSDLNHLDLSQSIIFTNCKLLVDKEISRIPFVEERIDFFDDDRRVEINNVQVMSSGSNLVRPMTAARGI